MQKLSGQFTRHLLGFGGLTQSRAKPSLLLHESLIWRQCGCACVGGLIGGVTAAAPPAAQSNVQSSGIASSGGRYGAARGAELVFG